jgi:hypothetical protein
MRVLSILILIIITAGVLSAQFTDGTTVTIDNSYLDWQKLPSSATFSSNYSPVFFNRERGGQLQKLRIEESVYWKRGGTLMREFKSYMHETFLYLYLEVNSPFAAETSIYCYPYSQRTKREANFFTIELVPEQRNRIGGVLLWESGSVLPKIIGRLRSSSINLECIIPLRDLPKSFIAGDIASLSFDLTTSYHEVSSGMYEEFFFTTLYFKDIIKREDTVGGM